MIWAPTIPAAHAFAITPDNDEDLAHATRGIYVGVAGDLTAILVDDTDPVTFTNLPVGVWPLQIKRVLATGTEADELIGLY